MLNLTTIPVLDNCEAWALVTSMSSTFPVTDRLIYCVVPGLFFPVEIWTYIFILTLKAKIVIFYYLGVDQWIAFFSYLYYNSRNNVCSQFLECSLNHIKLKKGSKTFPRGLLKLIQLYLRCVLISHDQEFHIFPFFIPIWK